MPLDELLAGSTSNRIPVMFLDSTSTTGAGLTGITGTTSGLTAWYWRENATANTAITLVNGTLGTYASGSLVAIANGNYQFCLPDAAVAAGAKDVLVWFGGAANMVQRQFNITLKQIDMQDPVRMGLTALPNANAGAVGGLVEIGTGANNFASDSSARITIVPLTSGTLTLVTTATNLTNNTPTSGTVTSGTIGLVTTTTNLTNNTPTSGTITVAPAPTTGTINLTNTTTTITNNTPTSGTITVAPAPTTGTINLTNTTTTLTNNTPTSGTITVSPAPTSGTITLVTTTTNLTNFPTIPNNWLTAAGIATGALNGKGDWVTSVPSVSAIVNGVLDEQQINHLAAGSIGSYIDGKTSTAISNTAKLPASYTVGSTTSAPVFTAAVLINAPTGGGGGGGSGADICTMTITQTGTGTPIANANVWITSDAAGTTIVAGSLPTKTDGTVVFLLDAGVTYYLWMQKDGEQSIQGQVFVAVAD